MATKLATRQLATDLEKIRPTETTVFETAVFGLLAELQGYAQLKEEKVASTILERRWEHVMGRACSLGTDWEYLLGRTPEQLQMAIDTARQDAEKYELQHGHPVNQWPTPDYDPFPGATH